LNSVGNNISITNNLLGNQQTNSITTANVSSLLGSNTISSSGIDQQAQLSALSSPVVVTPISQSSFSLNQGKSIINIITDSNDPTKNIKKFALNPTTSTSISCQQQEIKLADTNSEANKINFLNSKNLNAYFILSNTSFSL
jgi:hypothetical protein